MTFIANPIYDSVFKYMMEDDKVAKLLLSALLKKEIIELQKTETPLSCIKTRRLSKRIKRSSKVNRLLTKRTSSCKARSGCSPKQACL